MRQELISWAAIILPTFIFLSFPPPAFAADIVINEFSSDTDPDWVEIYNNSIETVDLALYKLKDNSTSGNEKNLSGQLSPERFISFDWRNSLNRAGDIISLIKISDGAFIDKVAYGDKGSDITAPSSAQTGGRQVDGTGTWVIFSSSTKNATNNTSTPVPTATLTPTPSPTPTKTPTPTLTTKPTAAAKVTPTPTATPSPTVKTSFSPTPEIEDNTPTSILGEMVTASPSASPTIAETKKASFFDFPKLVMGVGVIFVAASGILAFRRFHEKDNFN